MNNAPIIAFKVFTVLPGFVIALPFIALFGAIVYGMVSIIHISSTILWIVGGIVLAITLNFLFKTVDKP